MKSQWIRIAAIWMALTMTGEPVVGHFPPSRNALPRVSDSSSTFNNQALAVAALWMLHAHSDMSCVLHRAVEFLTHSPDTAVALAMLVPVAVGRPATEHVSNIEAALEPVKKAGKFRTREEVLALWNSPPPGVKDKSNTRHWDTAGYGWYPGAVRRLFGPWSEFVRAHGGTSSHWSLDEIMAIWNSPSEGVKNKWSSGSWIGAGYADFVSAVAEKFGKWSAFTRMQGKSLYREWPPRRINALWASPPELNNKESGKQWEKAGYGKYVKAVTRNYKSWPEFVKLKKAEESRLLEVWTHPPETVRDIRSREQWLQSGQAAFVEAATDYAGNWINWVRSRGLKPLWETLYTDEAEVARILGPAGRDHLTVSQEIALGEIKDQGNFAALNALIESQVHEVDIQLTRFLNARPSLRQYRFDLRHAALMGARNTPGGLRRAAELYDPNRRYRLDTFTVSHIDGALRKASAKIRKPQFWEKASLDDPEFHAPVPAIPDHAHQVEQKLLREKLEQAMVAIGVAKHHQMIIRDYMDEIPPGEIAEKFNIAPSRVSRVIARSALKLRSFFTGVPAQPGPVSLTRMLVMFGAGVISASLWLRLLGMGWGTPPMELALWNATPLPLSTATHVLLLIFLTPFAAASRPSSLLFRSA